MRITALIPLTAIGLTLIGCAGAPQGSATGTHVAGVTETGPMTTVGQDELNRQPGGDTAGALEHSSAAPYLSH
jgi:hypothetical protein